MALAPSAQQHHDTLPTTRGAMREVSVVAVAVAVAVAVTVGGLVVLHDQTRLGAREHDVSDVPAARG